MDKHTDHRTVEYEGNTISLRRKALEGGVLYGVILYLYKRIESHFTRVGEDYYFVSWIIYMVLFTTLFVLYNKYR